MSDATTHIPSRDEILHELSDIQVTQARDPADENARNMRRLSRAVRNAESQFALIFAVCNDRREQRRIGGMIGSELARPPIEVVVTGDEPTLLDTLSAAPGAPRPLFVYGLEKLLPSGDEGLRRREDTLHELQLRREQFRGLGRPLLLWLPEYAYTLIGQRAVDFWSWQSGGFFFTESRSFPRASGGPTSPWRDASNLPTLDRRFVKRPEMEAALEVLRDHRNLNLVGAGGAGKTSLALALAEELRNEFPDGRFYLDGGAARPKRDGLAGFVRSVIWLRSPEAHLPDDIAALRGMYLHVFTSRRCLFILDDVSDPQVAENLLPPANCALIVTSRMPLGARGLEVLRLGGLSVPDATRLLLEMAPALDQSLAQTIAAKLEGNPLAVRLAGSLLTESPHLADELLRSDATEFKRLMATALRHLYDRLDHGTARALRCCTVFPGSFDSEAEAHISQDPDNHLLLNLHELALVLRSPDGGRFRLAAAIRPVATSDMSAEELFEAQFRHADYYLTVCHRIRTAYDSASDGWRDVLDKESDNIKAGQSWTAANYRRDETIARRCSGYPAILAPILNLWLAPAERDRWFSAARDAARVLNDPATEAQLLFTLGHDAMQAGSNEAVGTLREAVQKARDAHRPDIETGALCGLAQLTLLSGNQEHAEGLARQALDCARDSGNPSLEIGPLMVLTQTYVKMGRLEEALRLNDDTIGVAGRTGNQTQRADAYTIAGSLHALAQDFARAAENFEEALRIRTVVGDQRGQVEAFRQLGTTEALAGRIEQGIGHLEQALKMARSSVLADDASAAAILTDLGRAYIAMGDIRHANDVSLQALELGQESGGQASIERALANLGMTTQRLGDYEGSERYLNQALALVHAGDNGDEARVLTELGRNYVMTGRHQEAEALLSKALTLAQQLKDTRLEEEIAALMSELHGRISEHAEAARVSGIADTSPAA
jgi:tetratricopeptide (TPR) repeat protein